MDMMREYVRRSEYHPDIEKLRELLSKVTDGQRLNILQCSRRGHRESIIKSFGPHYLPIPTGEECDRVLDKAAYRDDAEMITTILSSLQSSDRLKLLMMRDDMKRTSLHRAASAGHTESVKTILNSLTADQQMQLLPVEDVDGETAVEMAFGKTADVLSEYKTRARERASPGKFTPL